jgi:predicted DNA-binding protein (MmcQ/YjbR family)
MMPNESRRTKKRLLSVLYGSYATFAEAEKQKEINIKHNPEAWILIESL